MKAIERQSKKENDNDAVFWFTLEGFFCFQRTLFGIEEHLFAYYDMLVPNLKSREIRVFVDSDEDVTIPAAWFEDAGLEGMLPLEAQAEVDLARLREDHPDMLLMGAFDKMTMPRGEAGMRNEFERLVLIGEKEVS